MFGPNAAKEKSIALARISVKIAFACRKDACCACYAFYFIILIFNFCYSVVGNIEDAVGYENFAQKQITVFSSQKTLKNGKIFSFRRSSKNVLTVTMSKIIIAKTSIFIT